MSKKIYRFLSHLLQPVPLIYAEQNAPRPAATYATVRIANVEGTSFLLNQEAVDGIREGLQHAAYLTEINCYGPKAFSILNALSAAIKRDTSNQIANFIGIAPFRFRPVMNVSRLLDKVRYEERALFEVMFYQFDVDKDDVGQIDQVPIDCWRPEQDDLGV